MLAQGLRVRKKTTRRPTKGSSDAAGMRRRVIECCGGTPRHLSTENISGRLTLVADEYIDIVPTACCRNCTDSRDQCKQRLLLHRVFLCGLWYEEGGQLSKVGGLAARGWRFFICKPEFGL